MITPRQTFGCLTVVFSIASILAIASSSSAIDASAAALKRERFDKDPNWEGFNNRIVPKRPKVVKQDFGFSPTSHAGRAPGELGGAVQRSTTPASYAAKISPKSLDD